LSPQRVEATAEACGVRNGYRDPRQLGVDRWLAVVAAFARVHGAACVVDAGTALTVDAVDDTGLHLGGYIVPGLDLMQRALTSSTGDLAERSSVVHAAGRTLLADNTRDAISRGCIAALGALIERAHAALSASSAAPPALLLTGGDAAQIEAVLDVASETVPDLVLQGLRLVTD
jgi:type III pantothenate kinase